MGNEKNISIVNENNLIDAIEGDLLCAFELEGNKYVIYSKNEHDYDGNIIVYSGRIVQDNNRQYIKNIAKDEYENIKDIIKKMINYNGEENDV